MKRSLVALAVVCLALAVGAGVWLALRGSAPGQRAAAAHGGLASPPEVHPAVELAVPASLPAAEGEPERVAVAPAEGIELELERFLSGRGAAAPASAPLGTVDFVVHDTAGAPIAGASGSALSARGWQGAQSRTDGDGRGAIEVMPDTRTLRVSAVGYESTAVPLSAGAGPLTVVLRSTTLLEVRLDPAANLALKVISEGAAFMRDGRRSWMPDGLTESDNLRMALGKGALTVRDGTFPFPLTESSFEGKGSVTFGGAPGGVYALTGVRPGLALTLVLLDAHGSPVLKRELSPFVPGERRVVDLAAEPLAVDLELSTVLEVQLGAGEGLGIRLFAEEAPFMKDGEPTWTPEPEEDTYSPWTALAGDGSVTFKEAGVYVLPGVRPGLVLTLVLLDATGADLLQRKVSPLAAGERRVVDLGPALAARRLAGRVLSADGGPVKWAEITLGETGGRKRWTPMTDGRGDFCLEGIETQRVRLTVTHKDHAPLVLLEQPVTDEPLELVLERGRTVRVAVRGPDGSLVPGAAASLSTSASRFALAPLATPAGIVFEHAPSETLRLSVTAAGQVIERSIGPGSLPEEVSIELQAWQSCTVNAGALRDAAPARLVIHLDGEGQALQQALGAGEGSAHFEVLFPGVYEAYAVAPLDGQDERVSESSAIEVTPKDTVSVTLELRAP